MNIEYLRIQAPNVTTINNLFNWWAYNLSYIDISNMTSLTIASEAFAECEALRWVNISGLTNLVDAYAMFEDCYTLTKIDVSDLVSVQDASYMFSWDYVLTEVKGFENMTEITNAKYLFYDVYYLDLNSVSHLTKATNTNHMFSRNASITEFDCAGLSAVTDCSYMFSSCSNLKSVNLNAMVNASLAEGLFIECFSLRNVTADTFGQNAVSVSLNIAFNGVPITDIALPSAKLTVIYATLNVGTIMGNLQTLTFHAASPFSGSSPQITISYNDMSAEQINAIFTALPTLSGKSIDITGCTGAATCTRSIATAKGWTVTG